MRTSGYWQIALQDSTLRCEIAAGPYASTTQRLRSALLTELWAALVHRRDRTVTRQTRVAQPWFARGV